MFLVLLHDVTPRFGEPLTAILDSVTGLVGSRFACAIVPQWHGDAQHPNESRLWRSVEGCDELLMHGWTHQRTQRPGWLSRLTDHADEFAGLNLSEIQERIDHAQQKLLRTLGVCITGLVPPAWQLPVSSTDLRGVTHVVRWSRLESSQANGISYPLATWSYDWGRIPVSRYASHSLAVVMRKWQPSAIPCIVIHPADVRRGLLPYIMSTIRVLLDAGDEPTTPTNLLDMLIKDRAVNS